MTDLRCRTSRHGQQNHLDLDQQLRHCWCHINASALLLYKFHIRPNTKKPTIYLPTFTNRKAQRSKTSTNTTSTHPNTNKSINQNVLQRRPLHPPRQRHIRLRAAQQRLHETAQHRLRRAVPAGCRRGRGPRRGQTVSAADAGPSNLGA